MYPQAVPTAVALPTSAAGDAWWRPATADPDKSIADSTTSRTAFWSLVAFTVILLLSPQIWFPVLGTMRIAFVAAGLAIGAHLLQRLAHHPPVEIARPVAIAVVLVCWATITVPVSYWPGGSVEVLTDHYIKAVVFFWLISTLVTTTPRLRIFAWTLVLCSVPLAATAVRNFASGTFLMTRVPGLHRIYGYDGGSGIAGNPNDLALVLNLIVPIAAVMIVSARSALARVLAAVVMLLAAVAVIVTFSRAGFLTLVTTLVLFVLWLFRRRAFATAAALLLAGLIAVPFVPSGYADRLNTITNIEADRTGSAEGRWNDFQVAIGVVAHNPIIGVGIGQDVLAMNEYRGADDWVSVHNAFLQYGVDLGLPGLGLFLWMYFACLGTARRVAREARKAGFGDLANLATAVQIAMVGFGVAAFFHPIAYQFYFFTIGGMAVALGRALATERESAEAEAAAPAAA
jgi:probable O-glycosylation ligase (exosortase A-associated)